MLNFISKFPKIESFSFSSRSSLSNPASFVEMIRLLKRDCDKMTQLKTLKLDLG